jgi:hypothetical protein
VAVHGANAALYDRFVFIYLMERLRAGVPDKNRFRGASSDPSPRRIHIWLIVLEFPLIHLEHAATSGE